MDTREIRNLLDKSLNLLEHANCGLISQDFDPVDLCTEINKFCNVLKSKIQESEEEIQSSECKIFIR